MRYSRQAAVAALAATAAAGVVACGSSALKPPAGAAGSSAQVPGISSSVPSTAPPSPAPVASGTYQGACGYTLGDNPAGNPSTAVATGDIQADNNGTVGIVIKLTITWPQQGFVPLTETKTVRIPSGGSQDVQFMMRLTSSQVDYLQNWQLGHMGETGCTYNGTITGTYGPAE